VANVPYTPSTIAHTVNIPGSGHFAATPSKTVKNAVTQPRDMKSGARPKQHAYSPLSNRRDPTELAAQKALTALELQIKALKNEIDTLEQANQLGSSTQDRELEGLSDKWRAASQQAAEELFGTVKERVCRMGGVAAWRESEKQKFERSNGFGDFAPEPEQDDGADCEFDSQGEELPEEEQEFRKAEKKRVRQEALDAADVDETATVENEGKPKVWQESGNDDDVSSPPPPRNLGEKLIYCQSFTMDMMLRSLNVDLKVIGYDKASQRWRT